MGTFDLRALFALPADDDDQSVDEAQEISAFAATREVTGMCVVERDGDLFYGREVPVSTGVAMRAVGRHAFVRFEVKCAIATGSPIKNGSHAVVAPHPYSLGWSQFAPFKAPREQSRSSFDATPAETGELADALKWIDGLACDYWETKRVRTAGFSGLNQRLSWRGQRDNRERALHVLGLCPDAVSYHARLMEHRKVRDLLTATRDKTIRIGVPGALVTVNDEVVEESYELMTLAVRQALAGPHQRSEEWADGKRPVHEKVDRIYRDLLNARNRGVVGELRRQAEPQSDW